MHELGSRLSAYLVVFKVVREGYRVRDRIVLFLSVFYSLYHYLLNQVRRSRVRLCYRLWKDCLISNSSGLFSCRAGVNDALIVSETHELPLRHYFEQCQEGNFVDIGAHVGKYTVQVARQLKNRGIVISVEAHPGNFDALKKNIELNRLDNVIALNLACYSENGRIRLFRDSGSTATSAYSVVKKFQEDHISVEARRLDDILREISINSVNLMKIDVEQAEPEVLKGACVLLGEGKIKRIIFEASSGETVEKCLKILGPEEYKVKEIEIGHCLAELKVKVQGNVRIS